VGAFTLLHDPDEWFKRLPVDRVDHCLRIEHLMLSDLGANAILELALTLVAKPGRRSTSLA